MTRDITEWVAPGKGDTVQEIRANIFSDTSSRDHRRTALRLVEHGAGNPPSDLDYKRALSALDRVAAGEVAAPDPPVAYSLDKSETIDSRSNTAYFCVRCVDAGSETDGPATHLKLQPITSLERIPYSAFCEVCEEPMYPFTPGGLEFEPFEESDFRCFQGADESKLPHIATFGQGPSPAGPEVQAVIIRQTEETGHTYEIIITDKDGHNFRGNLEPC